MTLLIASNGRGHAVSAFMNETAGPALPLPHPSLKECLNVPQEENAEGNQQGSVPAHQLANDPTASCYIDSENMRLWIDCCENLPGSPNCDPFHGISSDSCYCSYIIDLYYEESPEVDNFASCCEMHPYSLLCAGLETRIVTETGIIAPEDQLKLIIFAMASAFLLVAVALACRKKEMAECECISDARESNILAVMESQSTTTGSPTTTGGPYSLSPDGTINSLIDTLTTQRLNGSSSSKLFVTPSLSHPAAVDTEPPRPLMYKPCGIYRMDSSKRKLSKLPLKMSVDLIDHQKTRSPRAKGISTTLYELRTLSGDIKCTITEGRRASIVY